MKKIHIVGKNPDCIEKFREKLEGSGFCYCEENPDLVVSYGGDGMFLIAERMFPGVMKILIRDSDIGNNCVSIDLIEALEKCRRGDYKLQEIKKLKAVHRGRFEYRELIGVNDVVIRNSLPTEAIRFRYRIVKKTAEVLVRDTLSPSSHSLIHNGLPTHPRGKGSEEVGGDVAELGKEEESFFEKKMRDEGFFDEKKMRGEKMGCLRGDWSDVLIGDGLVVSTAYGSTKGAYFYSIVQKSFDRGIGVAFNNITDSRGSLYLEEDDFIEIEIVRGVGVLVSDNNRDFINLEGGDKIRIGLIDDVARRAVFEE
jgi:hypothetical protein